MVLNLQPGRHRYTYELMAAVWRMSTLVVMQFKHYWGVRRPADRSALVQPILITPGHGSYPPGHSTQSYFMVAVLKQLLKGSASTGHDVEVYDQLDKLAWRIGENRIVAGLHYREDIENGGQLGTGSRRVFPRQDDRPQFGVELALGQGQERGLEVAAMPRRQSRARRGRSRQRVSSHEIDRIRPADPAGADQVRPDARVALLVLAICVGVHMPVGDERD